MCYRLALAAGRVDAEKLRAEMNPHQLDLWLAMYSEDPWGDVPLVGKGDRDPDDIAADLRALEARLGF